MKIALLAPLLFLIPETMPLVVHTSTRVSTYGRFGWPGGYFESRFKGKDVTVKVDAAGEPLRLIVDGQVRATLSEAGVREFTVSGLANG
ncbi:MAG: lipase, partial [Sphingomonadales bacterium]